MGGAEKGMKNNSEFKTIFEFSAGGLITDKNKVLLIRTKSLSGAIIWSFPKGKLDKYETSQEAALREVREETGYKCKIEKDLDEIKYTYIYGRKLVIKRVKWYLMSMEAREGSHDGEVDEILWAEYETAKELLIYKNDLILIEKVLR